MLFEYVVGGELFTYLRNAGKFNNSTGKLINISTTSVEFLPMSLYLEGFLKICCVLLWGGVGVGG